MPAVHGEFHGMPAFHGVPALHGAWCHGADCGQNAGAGPTPGCINGFMYAPAARCSTALATW
jgi:hypothetical protein